MHSFSVVILHAIIAQAAAQELAQNLMYRANAMPMHDANLDATTFAKVLPGTNVRAMSRFALPVTPGRAGFPLPRQPVNRGDFGKVLAGLQEETVAGRYAQGLFELAAEKKELDSVKASMEGLQLALDEVPELSQMLSSPSYSEEKKKAMIDKILEKGTTRKMCNYLIDKQRINVLPEIIGSFGSLYNEQMGIQECSVKSACKMEEDQLAKIAETVKKQTGAKKVKISESTDESLIGGFIVSWGGRQVDLSIRSALEGVRQELVGTASVR